MFKGYSLKQKFALDSSPVSGVETKFAYIEAFLFLSWHLQLTRQTFPDNGASLGLSDDEIMS